MKGIIQFVTIIIATSISSRYKRQTIREWRFLESLKPQSNMDQKALFVLKDCRKSLGAIQSTYSSHIIICAKVSSLMEI